ncbi:MAG: TRAP transporter small permease [Hylemonella sp.]|nr:TRAP transporter small permease [Hylemonella sp.]
MKRLLATTETAAALFLLGIALLTAGNVLMRDVLSIQIPDWFDGSKLMQGIALFWGFAIATYYGSHICVDIVWEQLRPQGRRWLDMVGTLVTLIFLAVMAWMVWVKVLSTGTQTTSDLQLPIRYFYAIAAFGVCASVLLALMRLVRLINRTPIEEPDEEIQHGS